jgi:hypothetical protein
MNVMRIVRRSMAVARIAASLLVVSASIALAADRLPGLNAGGHADGVGAAASASVPSMKISGHVSGMYPGRVALVRVRVKNPGHVAVVVKQVSATVGDAGAGCDSTYLSVKSSRKKLRIAPGRRVKLTLQATMLPDAPDACQGLTFPLAFHAKLRPA